MFVCLHCDAKWCFLAFVDNSYLLTNLGYSSGQSNGCCPAAASATYVDRNLLPLPVLDCACSGGRFRSRCTGENIHNAVTNCSPAQPDFSSFKDAAATDRLLRMSDAILFPVTDSAVNYGLEYTGNTSVRTANVCRACCTDSPIT